MVKFNLKSLIKSFVKMDVAIFIFVFLIVGSIIGTIIQQNLTTAQYQDIYGLFWGDIIKILQFDKAYYSVWYLFFLMLLIFSLIACLIINGKVIYKSIFKPVKLNTKQEISKAESFSFKDVTQALKSLKSQGFKFEYIQNYSAKKIEINNFVAIGYKNKVTHKIGYFATHIGVLGLCLAGLINAFWGFRADIDLASGTQTSKAIIYKSDDEKYLVKLPFIIRNEEFNVDFYNSNIVKEFTTDLQILDKVTNKQIIDHKLKVNSPLFINNFGIYQSSYYEQVKNINFSIFDFKTMQSKNFETTLDKAVELDNNYSITFNSFNKNTMIPSPHAKKYTEQDFGYSLEYTITDPLGQTAIFRTYKDYPDLLGVGIFDDKGQIIYKTIPVGLENNNQQMLTLFSKMLDKNKQEEFKAEIANYVSQLPDNQKQEFLSKLIHALDTYSQLNLNIAVSINDIDYADVSGIQVNYDPSANTFFASSLALCLGVIFMLYFRQKKAYIIKKDAQVTVVYF